MIAKKFRVPRENISYILKKGESRTSRLFIVRYKENDQHFFRYRVVVSKKLYPKAVQRNHLRRQIYEAMRHTMKPKPKTNQGLDLIFIPKKSILKTSYEEILADIKRNIIK